MEEPSSPLHLSSPPSRGVAPTSTPDASYSRVPTAPGTPATPSSQGRTAPTPRSVPRGDVQHEQRRLFSPRRNEEENVRVSTDEQMPDATSGTQYETLIWGTNINVSDTQTRFRKFLDNFRHPALEGETKPFYHMLLEDLRLAGVFSLNIDCKNLADFDEVLYHQLVVYPQEVIPIMDLVVLDLFQKLFPEEADQLQQRFHVRTFNLRETATMRELNPSDIDRMVSISGMITRVSGVMPDIKEAFFRCISCGHTAEVMINRGRIDEPQRCPSCGTEHSMALLHNRSSFSDKQVIKLQETPDAIPEGETPHTVNLFVYDDLVDVAKPGDRCKITGIYRAVPMRVSSRMSIIKAVYKTYIDVIHVRRTEKHRISRDTEGEVDGVAEYEDYSRFEEDDPLHKISTKEEEKLIGLSKDVHIYQKLVNALAPSIYEMEDIKKGILCQLFGGISKELPTLSGRFRGEMNVLLVGDPAVSKSQLLQFVHKIAPRGLYTSGKGSSAVGLTAYVTRDVDTGEFVLESGALVLSDRGICCIDEFDKMSDSARAVLHEVMEQQTVSVAKAGIVASLNARTSILASANPVESRYNPRMSVVDNIRMTPTLLSRFDLIYIVLDKVDELSDRRLARHLVSMYCDQAESTQPEIDVTTLTRYISYARRKIHPKISNDAFKALVDGYVDMRAIGGSKKVITATPRQLESLIRLSEALAKMRLSEEVTDGDVGEAIRLVRAAMQQAAVDPRTGQIDMDLITTGHSATERSEIAALARSIRSWLAESGTRNISVRECAIAVGDVLDREIAVKEFRSALTVLEDEDVITLGGDKGNRIVRK